MSKQKPLRFFFSGVVHSTTYLLISLCFLSSCQSKKTKSDLDIVFTQDTLNVGYTYWWEESGPFIGYCGKEYGLVFSGIVTQIDSPTNEAAPLYISQRGTIAIEEVYKIKPLESHGYANQKYFVSDCFNNLDVSVGDKVLVFCYDYEDQISIPGPNSIVPISDFDHPLVQATKRYIDEDEDAAAIKRDSSLWSAYGYGKQVDQLLRCKEHTEDAISK
ncbi:hypothetical protein B4Q04_04345 [Zobellia sp. OII3]|uniref:hypothetical protein n=1 Tax=Zobellia sp. OII3 TaxID=2034520 RepID=UPI000B532419|nr:hypothetical protein [Zobellia sp. OII3]OWW26915.1 hypothetical protein B4Q04_04345 [Zobellia sp. OII3]